MNLPICFFLLLFIFISLPTETGTSSLEISCLISLIFSLRHAESLRWKFSSKVSIEELNKLRRPRNGRKERDWRKYTEDCEGSFDERSSWISSSLVNMNKHEGLGWMVAWEMEDRRENEEMKNMIWLLSSRTCSNWLHWVDTFAERCWDSFSKYCHEACLNKHFLPCSRFHFQF
jgi:hypothetical protein